MACNYCKATVYIKTIQYTAPLLAPLTKAEELRQQLYNMTGEVYLSLPKQFCPMCGERIEVGLKTPDMREVVELPLILDCGYTVKIVRRDDYGNLYSTHRMTKREARDFLAKCGELTEKAEKALAEKKG